MVNYHGRFFYAEIKKFTFYGEISEKYCAHFSSRTTLIMSAKTKAIAVITIAESAADHAYETIFVKPPNSATELMPKNTDNPMPISMGITEFLLFFTISR